MLVIDNERLHTDLKDKEFVASRIEFVKLKKSGGVLVRGLLLLFECSSHVWAISKGIVRLAQWHDSNRFVNTFMERTASSTRTTW